VRPAMALEATGASRGQPGPAGVVPSRGTWERSTLNPQPPSPMPRLFSRLVAYILASDPNGGRVRGNAASSKRLEEAALSVSG